MRYYAVFAYSGQTSIFGSDNKQYSNYFVIHHPYLQDNVFVYNMEIIEQDSVSGTFSFTVPLNHPNISAFDCGLIVEVRRFDGDPESTTDAYTGGTVVWIGRLIDLESDMYGNLDCTCEGPLGFLKDGFISTEFALKMPPTTTIEQYIRAEIDYVINGNQGQYDDSLHHGRLPGLEFKETEIIVPPEATWSYLQAPIGTLDGFETNEEGNLCWYDASNPTNVFDFIKQYFETGLSSLAGIHYADKYIYMGVQVITNADYNDLSRPKTAFLKLILGEEQVSDIPRPNSQKIIFGDNLVNASLKYDFNNIATSLMVLGAEHDMYDGSKQRYNLYGTYDPSTQRQNLSYYIDADNGAIEKYGVIQKTVVNDDLTDQSNLLLWANMHRNALSNPVVEFSCTAIDLSTFDPNQDAFELGDYAEVRFPGLDGRSANFNYRCTGIKRNLLDPSKDEFTFSYSSENTLTSNTVFRTQSTTAGSSSSVGGGGSGEFYSGIRSISVNQENIPPVNGNVDISVPVLKKTSQLNFQNIDNGYFTETIDGGVTTQFRTIQDSLGRITRITDQDGHSTEIIW